MNDLFSGSLYGPLFASADMRAIVADERRMQRMLDVEASLARAEAAAGVIPKAAAPAIEAACTASRYDAAEIGRAAALAGNVAIPVVKALTAEVAKTAPEAARYVHWGATSQDIIDTAMMLELRAGLDALCADLDRAIAAFARLAESHRHSAAAGRTLMQQALPVPFGLKLAGYAAALMRSRARLRRLRTEAILLQFGGAAGTLASLGERGLDVAELLGRELGLGVADAPWHAHRDRIAEIAAALAILAGTCGKIARDVTILAQTEIAEVAEPAGADRGGSSTMPQKRNPSASAMGLACANLAPHLMASILSAMVGENERSAGAWQSEWVSIPALLLVVSGALHLIADMGDGLEIDPSRMRANLDIGGGQIMAEAVMMALAPKLGRLEAHRTVEDIARKAAAEQRPFSEALVSDARVLAHFQEDDIKRLLDPLAYQGMSQAFIDRLLASSRAIPQQ